MYYLSEYYFINDDCEKCKYFSLETIKFINFYDLEDYIQSINDECYDNDNYKSYLLSVLYFNSNISIFYIYFKAYHNLINCYSENNKINKYKNEIEYIINNWKYNIYDTYE